MHTHLLDESLEWSAGQVISTPRPVQRIEVVTGWRPPVRLLLTGAASQRDVAIGDGDIYAADLD